MSVFDYSMNAVFDVWVRAMLRHRAAVLVAVVVISLGLGWVAARLPLVTAISDYIPEDAKGRVAFETARERFGGDEVVLVAVQADDHFTAAGLDRIRATTEALASNPLVERVLSLSNAQTMWIEESDPETLRIDTHLREGPTPAQVRAAVMADQRLAGNLISEDGELALFAVELVPSSDAVASDSVVRGEIARLVPGAASLGAAAAGTMRSMLDMGKQAFSLELPAWFGARGYDAERTHAVGFTSVLAFMVAEARRNLLTLFPITVLLIALTLLWLLRRGVDALVPLLAVVPAVVWAVALGGLVCGRLTVLTSMAPVMVLVVGVSDVVHLITQFRHELARGYSRDDAIQVAFQKVGTACALTSVTTLVGFGSMILLPLPMSQELGVFAGLGVAAAFVLSFVLTPIALSFMRSEPAEKSGDLGADRLSHLLAAAARLVHRHPVAIVAAGVVVSVFTVGVASTITVENSLTRKLAAEHPIRASVAVVDQALSGSVDFEVLVDGGAPGALEDPPMIAALSTFADRLKAHPGISSVIGVSDVLEQMHQVMAPSDAAKLPSAEATIAQYLLLFEMSGGRDLDALVDDSRRYARYALRSYDGTAEGLVVIGEDIEAIGSQVLPKGATADAGGLSMLAARLGPRLLSTSLQGFATVLGLIAILMAILFRSLRVGLMSLVPNVLPVGLGVVTVHLVFEQVDADTLTFLAICIGVAVDDTIHFLARYRIERTGAASRADAVTATIHEAGHGIVRTSVILVAGFTVLGLSDYQPLATMGWMLPITLASAVLLDLTLLPAMVTLGLLDPKARADAAALPQAGLQLDSAGTAR